MLPSLVITVTQIITQISESLICHTVSTCPLVSHHLTLVTGKQTVSDDEAIGIGNVSCYETTVVNAQTSKDNYNNFLIIEAAGITNSLLLLIMTSRFFSVFGGDDFSLLQDLRLSGNIHSPYELFHTFDNSFANCFSPLLPMAGNRLFGWNDHFKNALGSANLVADAYNAHSSIALPSRRLQQRISRDGRVRFHGEFCEVILM